MAQIGCLGEQIVFSTSDQRILTFQGFTQKISGRWSKHAIIGCRPLSEFNGPELRRVTFKIMLDAKYGVRPRRMMETMEEMVEKGLVESLVIGNKKVGVNRWKMTEISEAWDIVYSGGELAKATVSITLEEYL